jgi:hypothetical protein
MDRSVSQPFPIYMWLSKGDCLGKWSVLVNNGAQKDVSAPSGPGLCAFVHLSGSILRETPFIYRKRSFYQDRLGTNIGKTQKQTAFSTFPMFCPEPVLANGMVFVFMKTWRGFKANKELSVLFSLSVRTSRLRSQSLALPMHLRKTRLCFLKCLSYVCPEPVLVKSSFYM